MRCSVLYLQSERPHRYWTLMSPSISFDCVVIFLPAFTRMPENFSYSLQLLQHFLLCCCICGLMNRLKIWLKFHEKQTGYGDVAGATGWRFIMYEENQSGSSLRNQVFRFNSAVVDCGNTTWNKVSSVSICLLMQVLPFLNSATVRTLQFSVIKFKIKLMCTLRLHTQLFLKWFQQQLDWEELAFPVSSCQSDYV